MAPCGPGGQLVLGSTPQVYVRTTTGTVAATTGVVSNGGVYAVSQNTNDVPLVVQGYASQSGNLLNFKNASGSAIAGVSAAGNFFTASSYDQNNNSTLLIGNANATAITLGKSASNILTTISGTALVKPTSGNDSTTAFQVQTAGGLSLLSADSTNSIINHR